MKADLPLGTSDFAVLRMRRQIYVDKTSLICELASKSEKFFLIRPRRFGKSLLVSTFESLFKNGLRDFQGLAIERLWKDDGRYLVVRLDFSNLKYFSAPDEFSLLFDIYLSDLMTREGLEVPAGVKVNGLNGFANWLAIQPVNSVVILIDEYDAPLTACLDNPDHFEYVRKELSNFYSMIKVNDGALRFFFITGITNFGKASVFSELDTLADISLLKEYGTLLGFTREETETCFGAYLDNAAAVQKLSRAELMDRLAEQYDGYRFSKKSGQSVLAPWSLLEFLGYPGNGFKNYWFSSGGPSSLLLKYMKSDILRKPEEYSSRKSIDLEELSGSTGAVGLSDIGLLTQAGYLTIRTVEDGVAFLDYPNLEVRGSMALLCVRQLLGGRLPGQVGAGGIRRELISGNSEAVCRKFNLFFASIDYQNYQVKEESTVRAIVQAYLAGTGLDVRTEVHNFKSRSDLKVRAGHRLWVFEFKVVRDGGSAANKLEEAVGRIASKEYGLQQDDLEVIRVGLVFSESERKFVEWTEVL